MKLPKGFKTLVEPYEYQKEAMIFGMTKPVAGILLDLGLGKTYVAINIARYRIQFCNVKKVLVVCPTSILLNWEDQIRKYSEYRAVILHADRNTRIRRFKENAHFYIINYEALYPFIKHLLHLKPEMVIFDESSRFIKNYKAKRTKAAIAIADRCKYKLILTGTFISNRPTDIWSQFRVLDGGLTFGNNYYSFLNFFFRKVRIGAWFKYVLKTKRVNSLQKGIYNLCIRKSKREVLKDLPDRIYNKISIELGELGPIYKDVESSILTEIDTLNGSLSLELQNILTKLLRLQQITAGFIKQGDEEKELIYQPKLDAVVDRIESVLEEEESVIVWCRFLKSISLISNRLKDKHIKYITMSGLDKDKFSKWKTFQKSKNINVFIAQIESGGIGIELFKEDSDPDKSQHMIFYENTWSMDVRTQAFGRNDRIGQKSVCVYTDLVIKNTIDEKILNAIQRKEKIADLIMKNGVKEFLK